MKCFVGISFGPDHGTRTVGVFESREIARRAVELTRGQTLSFSPHAVDGPEGDVALDDINGDCVGYIKAFSVFGESKLDWELDSESDSLMAASQVFHDEGLLLYYHISKSGSFPGWEATFEGSRIANGEIDECLAACRKSDDQAKLDACQE